MKKKIVSDINLREDRLPPGQRWISAPIVYDIVDDIPNWDMGSYRFKVWGEVEEPLELTYEELLSLPSVEGQHLSLQDDGASNSQEAWLPSKAHSSQALRLEECQVCVGA
jgi:hypothetical protein